MEFERWATPKETILRKTQGMTKRKRCKMKGGRNRQIAENPRKEGKKAKEINTKCQRAEERH